MLTDEQIAAIFTEWLRQYQENPDAFEGDPIDTPAEERTSYGVKCARCFTRIAGELAA